jgi:hypothetical protein
MINDCFNWSEGRLQRVRRLIRQLYLTVGELNDEFKQDGRKFTPDGHLVGSIGEVVAAYAFDLKLNDASAPIHDATTRQGLNVQIKLTGGTQGVSLYAEPDFLIVIQLCKGALKLVYNGPGDVVWNRAGKQQKNGQRPIALGILRELNKDVDATKRIHQCREFPELS